MWWMVLYFVSWFSCLWLVLYDNVNSAVQLSVYSHLILFCHFGFGESFSHAFNPYNLLLTILFWPVLGVMLVSSSQNLSPELP